MVAYHCRFCCLSQWSPQNLLRWFWFHPNNNEKLWELCVHTGSSTAHIYCPYHKVQVLLFWIKKVLLQAVIIDSVLDRYFQKSNMSSQTHIWCCNNVDKSYSPLFSTPSVSVDLWSRVCPLILLKNLYKYKKHKSYLKHLRWWSKPYMRYLKLKKKFK